MGLFSALVKKKLSEATLKSFKLMVLAEEVSRQSTIDMVPSDNSYAALQ